MNLTALKYYDELTPSAQDEARRNVVAAEASANSRNLKEAYRRWNSNIHKAVNDTYHIKRLVNGRSAWIKIKRLGDYFVVPYIRSNRLVFTDGGDYISYVESFTVYTKGAEYTPTTDEQSELLRPYIDVNERGPSFHKSLTKKN